MSPVDQFHVILEGYIARGDLSPETEVEHRGDTVVLNNFVVPKRRRRRGIAERFLREVKAVGVAVDICQPKRSSLPFWAKMFERGLIPHTPYEYTTWEDS